LDFIRNKSLGFDQQNVLLVSSESDQVRRNLDAFKSVLKSDPRILSVAGSSSVPGDREFSDTVFKRDDSDDIFDLTFLSCDYDFVETLGFRLLRGRNFSREFGAESRGAVLLNRRAVAELGLTPEEAVGRNLLQAVTAEEFRPMSIIGVLEDFHFKSLHRAIEPMVVRFDPDRVRMVAIRIRPGNMREAVGFVRGKWEEAFPGEEFNFRFLDDWIGRLYESENRTRSLFQVFAALSIFVACLGLLGLAAFTAQERTKEIGVRKVLGASVPNLVGRLSWEFTRWVLAANLIAWPAAFFAMNRWSSNFAYRASIGAGPFLAAAALSLITAWLTIGFQAVKAARTDPVRALRWE
jgi:putative ABC transport system permease protein